MILDGSLVSPWLQGRSCWGARGFFPSSCVRELGLSARHNPRSPYGSTLEMPSYGLGQARALMGLSAQLEEELDFREGDVITIVGIPEPGWFEGELGGQRGIFPEGFVELLGPLKSCSNSEEPTSSEVHRINGVKEVYPQAEEKSWSDGEELPGPYGVAVYQFQALESAELDFDVGDRIRILDVLEDGWLEGEFQGRRGIFPHRFVRLEESSPPSREKWEFGCLPKDMSSEARSPHKADPTAAWKEPEWNPSCSEDQLRHLTERQEGCLDSEFKQCEILNHQSEGSLGSFPSDMSVSPSLGSAKTVNGVSCISQPSNQPRSQLSCQLSNPETSQISRNSWGHLGIHHPSERDVAVPSISHKNIFCEDFVSCMDVQRRKPKSRSSSFSGTHEGRDTWPVLRGTRAEKPPGVIHGESCGDLDSKLTEQLTQFEQSLASPIDLASHGSSQQDSVSRHFSILDFGSEKDIVRGSVEHKQQRRKVLRPPPPRPSTPASIPSEFGSQTSPLTPTVRPSRPAPLPPPGNQRRCLASAKMQMGSKEGYGSTDEPGGASQYPFLLNRIQELEQELDVYGKTRAELSAMLEQAQDDLGRAETQENLDFCDCNMSSLRLELQELRGKYNNEMRPQ